MEGLNGAYSKEWATYAEMPSVIELSSGEYTITATSPKTTDSVWGEPVYSGEEKFAIVVGGTSTVEVECGISNVKVTLSTNETFSKEIPEYEITVTDEEGKSLTWTQDDDLSQSGYFSASTLDVRVKGYRWDNVNNDGEPSIATFSQKIENVSPAHHYILNLSAKTTGKGTFNITIDDTLVDEEEIGSTGSTGMDSKFFENAVSELLARLPGGYDGLSLRRMLMNSYMLSSDVNSAYDPLNASLFDKKNSSFLGGGIVFNKYTGSRGKSGASDANAEFIAKLRAKMDADGVPFQMAELAKVDVGGGGTIAKYAAYYGMSVIDAGVAVMSMHAPWEITATKDVEGAVRCYKAFLSIE